MAVYTPVQAGIIFFSLRCSHNLAICRLQVLATNIRGCMYLFFPSNLSRCHFALCNGVKFVTALNEYQVISIKISK